MMDVCAAKLDFSAARQFDFLAPKSDVILCSVRCCTDFVARAKKLRFGGGSGGNKIPKSVHDNGFVWSIHCVFNKLS